MKLFIPQIGDSLVLEKDWAVTIRYEERNKGVLNLFGYDYEYFAKYTRGNIFTIELPRCDKLSDDQLPRYEILNECIKSDKVEPPLINGAYNPSYLVNLCIPVLKMYLPAKTRLVVDRVYIRRGGEVFNSLTFKIAECAHKKLNKKRFWASLENCNEMFILT